MTEDMLARLAAIQRQAAELRSAVSAIQSQPQPQEGRGTDPGGWVSVTVEARGLPSRIEVRTGWQRQVAPEELGALVMAASAEALSDLTRAWSESVDVDPLRSDVRSAYPDGQEPAASTLQRAAVYGHSRDPLALTEEILAALKAAQTSPDDAEPSGRGSGGNSAVTITLGSGGLSSCTIDARWAAQHGASGLNRALVEALSDARQALNEQAERRRADAQNLTDLMNDALATLVRLEDRQPKER
ncbi:YbaB/EbfC family nucleoid-associated protein [Micromonospora aurantiaca]|uniref:YbaB/EbfC family nucleoid-associated protein n=1 Tax=Micromonospora aurantiaca (nom. illeg.) TaxID=47850 RepID=UPI0033D0F2CD